MSSLLIAANLTQLSDLNNLKFQDAFEKEVSIPTETKKVIVSFGKKSNALMSEYLNKQEKGFLPNNKSIYIGDIYDMPSMITYMFARPKMQKYNFTIFLYNEEGLDTIVPSQEDKLTIITFDDSGKITNISFSNKPNEIFN